MDCPRPLTCGACALEREETLRLTHAASTSAHLADFRLGAGFRAGARTWLAGDGDRNIDLRGFSGERFFECDFHIVAQVRAALAAATPRALSGHAEQVFKNIGEGGCKAGTEAVRALCAVALLERGVTVTVVGRALVAVFQDFVGFGNFLELVLASRIARIFIRMPLHREFAE